jgi:galactokinase
MSVDTGRLLEEFAAAFGRTAEVLSVAPGRVNLIGEHTDYNEGFVLPVAIDRTVAVAAAGRDDGHFRVRSLDYGECDEFTVQDGRAGGWRDYVRGVAWAFAEAGHPTAGADLAIGGDVPQGAGLSSSAAIEVAVAGALAATGRVELAGLQVARLARRAENEFVGVQCGIMDQFASALCRSGHALLVDCQSLEVKHIPLALEEQGVSIVIIDSKVPRRLADTAYNRRMEECGEAARALSLESLREAGETAVEVLPEPLRRRARHVVRENLRVTAAVAALGSRDVDRFGALMFESHASLRDDFEVSCRELDLLVELALSAEGVLGARLTGAGFGGCTVNLVRGEMLDGIRGAVVERYRDETGLPAEMHVCRAVDGLKVMHV